MAKYSSYPTLLEHCKTISISDFKRWGLLKLKQVIKSEITWSRNGNKIGSISISVNTFVKSFFVELNYSCNGTPINYRVPFYTVGSNLNKGIVWFFICPHTGKRCRKLHLVGNYFYHRSAFINCMYENQSKSHSCRKHLSMFDKLYRVADANDTIHSKHFKKYYRGLLTKRYIKAIKRVNAGAGISMEELLLS